MAEFSNSSAGVISQLVNTYVIRNARESGPIDITNLVPRAYKSGFSEWQLILFISVKVKLKSYR